MQIQNYNNKIKYDGLREYCLSEGVNEEYLRKMIVNPGYFGNMKAALLRRIRNLNKNRRNMLNLRNEQ